MSAGLGGISLRGSQCVALTAAARQIRAVLGTWPVPGQAWQICLDAPAEAGPHDWLISAGVPRGPVSAQTVFWVGPRALTLWYRGACYELGTARASAPVWVAALAAFASCGFEAPDALALALAWRDGDALRADPWPTTLARFAPLIDVAATTLPAFAPCPNRLGLYPVLPSAAWVERVLAAGVRTVQLRVKQAEPPQLRAEIAAAVAAGRRYPGARVFINDHWQDALEAGAYGVHLGQEDLGSADLAALARTGLRLGLSSHGYYEIVRALQLRPSYLALGPIFATTTKQVAAAPQGLQRLARYVQLAGPQVPLVAIGGINSENLAAVLASGVGSAALVGAVTSATDLCATIAALQQNFGENS